MLNIAIGLGAGNESQNIIFLVIALANEKKNNIKKKTNKKESMEKTPMELYYGKGVNAITEMSIEFGKKKKRKRKIQSQC